MRYSLRSLFWITALVCVVFSSYSLGHKNGYNVGYQHQWYPSGKQAGPESYFGSMFADSQEKGIILFNKDGIPWWHVYIEQQENHRGGWWLEIRNTVNNPTVTDEEKKPVYESTEIPLKLDNVNIPKMISSHKPIEFVRE